jgi:hypothetical protein
MSDAVNREWLYLRGGQQMGPVSLTELRQLAAAGQIQPHDNVWKAGMAQWAAAQTIPGLFALPPSSSPPVPARSGPALPEEDARSRRQESSRRNRGGRDDDDDDGGQTRSGKKSSGPLKWVLIGGGLLVLSCCGILGLASMGGKAKQQEQTTKVEQTKDAISVSAVALFQAYKNNEVDANNRYKDKVVEVSGTVHGVKERYVELDEDNSRFLLGLVHVSLKGKSKEKMGRLNKGQFIKVRGVCTGKSFAVNIENAVLLD